MWVSVAPRKWPVFVGVACAAGLSAGAAFAGDWKLTDTFRTELSYVDRSGNRTQSGAVLQATPRLRLAGSGARVTADINYAVTGSVGSSGVSPDSLSHDLVGKGRVEVIEDMFFLGANASAKLVGSSATSGTVDSINADDDGRQSYSIQVTPQFRHHLGKYADVVSNNSLDYVSYSGGNSSNDGSRSMTGHVGVQSGRHFGPLSWTLDTRRKRTRYDQREDKNSSYDAGIGYRIDGNWRVRGKVGYETNDVQTSRGNTDGMTWSTGADWTPNERTSASVDYGSRYVGNVFSGKVQHRTRRTLLSMDFSRDVTNRRSTQLVDSFFFQVDPNTGSIIVDPNTGAPIVVNIPQLEQTDEDFVNTQLRGAVTVTGRRTTATVTANVANRKYEVTGRDEDSYGLTVSASRQLGASFSARATGNLTHSEGTTGGSSDTYDMQFSLSRRLSPRTSASLNLLHRDHDASTATGSYTENRIGISLQTSFL